MTQPSEKLTAKGAYLGARHSAPQLVRNIRLAIDVGMSRRKLLKIAEKHPHAEEVRLCIDFMLANPRVGVCRFIEGDRIWQWSEIDDPTLLQESNL